MKYILSLIIACALSNSAFANDCEFKPFSKIKVIIKKVVDGDTVKIEPEDEKLKKCFKKSRGRRAKLKNSIRMMFMDTPESTFMIDGDKKSQGHFAIAAKKELLKMIPVGTKATLRFYNQATGIYGRLLGTIHVGKKNINLEMVRKGMAYPFFYAPAIKDYEKYIVAHLQAASQGLGQFDHELERTLVPHEFRSSLTRKSEAPFVGNLLNGEILDGDAAELIPAAFRIFAVDKAELEKTLKKIFK